MLSYSSFEKYMMNTTLWPMFLGENLDFQKHFANVIIEFALDPFSLSWGNISM